jgi:hypothetical protein
MFYPFDGENRPFGRLLRTGLDNFRDGLGKLTRVNGMLQQMSDQQAVDAFGFPDTATAAAAKAELASDVGKQLINSDEINVNAATLQMLAQFG